MDGWMHACMDTLTIEDRRKQGHRDRDRDRDRGRDRHRHRHARAYTPGFDPILGCGLAISVYETLLAWVMRACVSMIALESVGELLCV